MTDSQSKTNSTNRPATTRRSRFPGWLLAVALTLLASTCLICVVGFFSSFVFGEEFSPDTFERRMFHYNQIPVLQVQVWPISRTSTGGTLEDLLTKKKFIAKTNVKNPRWDINFATHIKFDSEKCDARILCKYLDTPIWLDWTNQHPTLAKVFWPLVADVARDYSYTFLPDMFQIAQHASNPEQLEQSLHQILNQKYKEFGMAEQALGNHQKAADYLGAALKYDSEDTDSRKARAKSLKMVKQAAATSADTSSDGSAEASDQPSE